MDANGKEKLAKMTGYLWTIFIILIWAIFLALLFKKKIIVCIPTVFFLTIIFQYISSLMGNLVIGRHFIVLSAFLLVAMGLMGYFLRRQSVRESLRFLLVSELAIWCLIAIWLFFYLEGKLFYRPDEFSHWGTVVKDIYVTGKLYTEGKIECWYAEYPPALALVQYFFCSFQKGFIEADTYRAYALFCISMMLVPLKNFSLKKQIIESICFVCIALMAPLMFDGYALYDSIYVDTCLSILSAYIIWVYYEEKDGVFKTINLSLATCVLVLIKSSGVGLAILCAMLIAVDRSILFWHTQRHRRDWLLPCLGISILTAKLSWSGHLKYFEVYVRQSGFDISQVVSLMQRIVIGCLNETDKNILVEFAQYILKPKMSPNGFVFPPLIWLIIFFMLANLAIKLAPNQNQEKILVLSLIGITSFWIFGTFLTCRIVFGKFVGADRYIPCVCSLVVIVIIYRILLHKRELACYVFIGVVCILCINFPGRLKDFITREHVIRSIAYREKYADMYYISDLAEHEKNLLFVSQDTQYSSSLSLAAETYWYLASPHKWTMSFENCLVEDWSRCISVDEFCALLISKDINYVYLYMINKEFTTEYQSLFENPIEENAYYVVHSDGKIRLEKYK